MRIEPLITPRIATANRLRRAVIRSSGLSMDTVLDHLFAWMFRGLVYPQIWEDPVVDMAALEIRPDSHVLTIASGGCNVLSYLIADPARITAVDLSAAHVALNKLKIAAVRHLPDWASFHRFFGAADSAANVLAYERHLAPLLDAETRRYWERRRSLGLGRPRIARFAENFYRHGMLGRFIGFAHWLARSYGIDPRGILATRTIEEQRRFFDNSVVPLFDKKLVRWMTGRSIALYGLGIPPAQYESLAAAGGGDGMAAVLRGRLERLTCDFPLGENYFTWQAFARGYAPAGTGPLPPYLQAANFEIMRERCGRIEILNRSLGEYLATRSAGSLDRYVLLDAQDWMTDAQLQELWREITRTARPGARIVFRTAGEATLLPGRIEDAVLARWDYAAEASRDFHARDHSAIYGGFHLYVLRA